MFEEFSIVVLRAFVRSRFVECRGAGKLGNVGTKGEIINLLESRGVSVDEVADFEAEYSANHPVSGDNQTTTAASVPAAAAAAVPSADNANILGAVDALKSTILAAMAAKPAAAAVDEKAVEAICRRVVAEENEKHVKRLEVKRIDGTTAKLGAVHEKTADIIAALSAGQNVWLVGPAGSGKTTAADKVAEALGLRFFPLSVGPQTTKSDLVGYRDANGNYQGTIIREAFENGGLLLIDEIDAANSGVLTILNSLLANGYCSFPDKVVKRHPDFRCIAAANTYGRGADRQYVGRCQIDEATLNRFSAFIEFDYDEKFEMELCTNKAWCKHVQNIRLHAAALNIRLIVSPRASINGEKLLAAGFSADQVRHMAIWHGLPKEQIAKIMAYVPEYVPEKVAANDSANDSADAAADC